MVLKVCTRKDLLRFLRQSELYAQRNMLGEVVYKETPHGPYTDVVVSICTVRKFEVASILFANRHAVLHVHSQRFIGQGKLGESIVRPPQGCKLIGDYFRRAHAERRAILQTANTFDYGEIAV